MDIENDRSTAKTRHERAENEEIGNGMDVNQMIFPLQIIFGDMVKGAHQEKPNTPGVRESAQIGRASCRERVLRLV